MRLAGAIQPVISTGLRAARDALPSKFRSSALYQNRAASDIWLKRPHMYRRFNLPVATGQRVTDGPRWPLAIRIERPRIESCSDVIPKTRSGYLTLMNDPLGTTSRHVAHSIDIAGLWFQTSVSSAAVCCPESWEFEVKLVIEQTVAVSASQKMPAGNFATVRPTNSRRPEVWSVQGSSPVPLPVEEHGKFAAGEHSTMPDRNFEARSVHQAGFTQFQIRRSVDPVPKTVTACLTQAIALQMPATWSCTRKVYRMLKASISTCGKGTTRPR